MMKILSASILVIAIGLIHSCARNPVTGKRQVVFMSEEQEIALGREADPQIVAQFGLYEDSALQRFIRQEGNRMAAISHRPNLIYTFRILNSEAINAFAVPGGYVYFTRGIMGYFNNEAEMAGVLGHEIGHITARHSVQQQRNQMLAQIGLIAGIVIAPNLAQFAEAASTGLGLLLLKYGRDAERESDNLGVEYSSKIGYDAREMADFFNTLERVSAGTGADELPTFLSTHPNPGDRNTAVARTAAEWQQRLNLTNPIVNRDQYLRRIDGLIYGEDPREGYREGNMFYHPVLRFQFAIPQGWMYQNTPQRVQMAPQDGRALLFLTLAQGNNLQEAASNVLRQYNLSQVESRNTTVNGLPAVYLVADQQAQQGVIRTLSYLIQYGNYIYHMIGVTSLADFNNFAPVFNSSIQSFRQLTDQSKINRQPDRIRVKPVRTTGTLQQALLSYNMPQGKLEQLAIINGMRLNDQVTAGMLIKVVE